MPAWSQAGGEVGERDRDHVPERERREQARLPVLLRHDHDELAGAGELVGEDFALERLDDERPAPLVGEEARDEARARSSVELGTD